MSESSCNGKGKCSKGAESKNQVSWGILIVRGQNGSLEGVRGKGDVAASAFKTRKDDRGLCR